MVYVLGTKDTVEKMISELKRARTKFHDFASAHEGYAVLLEELDEMWNAIKMNDIEHARKEAIQVGAMAMRFIQDSFDWEK